MINSPPSVDLSWVAPMYRTSLFAEELCMRIVEASQGLGVHSEIVLVDDACPEDSAGHALRINCPVPLRVFRHKRNMGQDSAIRSGLRLCRGRYAVVLDADLQDPPEALHILWPHIAQGFDTVFANRFGAYEVRTRLLTSRLYRTAVHLLGGLPPGAGLFVLMNRRTIDAICATRAQQVSILAAIAATKGRCASVPIERTVRRHGVSAYGSIRRSVKALRSLWQVFVAYRLGLRL